MNAGPDVERLLSDWLIEEAPARAPDRILLTTSDRLDHTRQRRFGVALRSLPMRIDAQLAAAAVIGVLLVGGAAYLLGAGGSGVGGAPTPTSSPTVTPASSEAAVATPPLINLRYCANPAESGVACERFESPTHGYSVSYLADWTVTPATVPWRAGVANLWGSGINDEISGETARFSGASQPLAPGQTADQWIAAYAASAYPGSANPEKWPAVDIGGQTGYIDADGVPALTGPAVGGTIWPGGIMYDAVVIVDGRAYNFNMDGNVRRGLFDGMLQTVNFDAPSAVDVGAGPTEIPRVLYRLASTFISPTHGYSVGYPDGWVVTPAKLSWSPGAANLWNSGINDELKGPRARFSGASQPLGPGLSADDWLRAYAGGSDPATWPTVTIGGRRGYLDADGVLARGGTIHPGGVMYDAVILVDGRAYNFNMDGEVDRAMFEAFLSSVVFDPSAASDATPAPSS